MADNVVLEEDNRDIVGDCARENVDENHCLTELKFLLTGVVKRHYLNVDDLLINDSSSVMECGMHALSTDARKVIKGYYEEVERCLEFVIEITSASSPKAQREEYRVNSDLMGWIRKLKHNMGRSALILSGGGSMAMYHVGTVKALCEAGLYDQVAVISGVSDGSITTAMCAFKIAEDLLRDFFLHVRTDSGLDGRMKKENIPWFTKVVDMGAYWMKHKLMVDSKRIQTHL